VWRPKKFSVRSLSSANLMSSRIRAKPEYVIAIVLCSFLDGLNVYAPLPTPVCSHPNSHHRGWFFVVPFFAPKKAFNAVGKMFVQSDVKVIVPEVEAEIADLEKQVEKFHGQEKYLAKQIEESQAALRELLVVPGKN
jgi:Prefoldin subunit